MNIELESKQVSHILHDMRRTYSAPVLFQGLMHHAAFIAKMLIASGVVTKEQIQEIYLNCANDAQKPAEAPVKVGELTDAKPKITVQ